MERHLSTGLVTIVALMAAHRAVSEQEERRVALCQKAVERTDAKVRADRHAAARSGVEAAPIPAPRSVPRH